MEIRNPQSVWRLRFEGAWPTSVAFAGSSRRLVAGNRDGDVLLWDLPESPPKEGDEPPTVDPTRRLVGHENAIARIVALGDGRRVVSASLDRTVRLWDVEAEPTGRDEVVVDVRQREAEAKKTRSDEPLKRPGVDVATIAAERVIATHGDWVLGLGVDAGGGRVISGDDGGVVAVYDVAAAKELARWDGWPGNGVVSACLSPDGNTAFVAEYRAPRGDFDRPPAMARLYDAESGELKVDLLRVRFPDVKEPDNSYGYSRKWREFVGRGFVASAFSPDGKLLAVGQGGEIGDAKVHLVDTATGKVTKTVSNHRYGVCDVAFSSDGRHLLTAGRDTTVRIVQVDDGKEVAALGKERGGQFKDWMHAIAVSPDERYVAGADIGGIVHVWRLAS